MFVLHAPMIHALPGFLMKEGYRNSEESQNTAFHQAFGTKMNQVEWLMSKPEMMKIILTDFMPIQRGDQISWMDQPQISLGDFEMSEEDVAKGRPMFVDLGGGHGWVSMAWKEKRPELKGRIVLQDVVPVPEDGVKKIDALSIERQIQDFNNPQPLDTQGAKVYYMRNVLHDWPDSLCVNILIQLKNAMARDSIILLDELVMPDVGADWKAVNYDMNMMSFLSAQERTETHWKSLLNQVGLQIRETMCYDNERRDSLIFVIKE